MNPGDLWFSLSSLSPCPGCMSFNRQALLCFRARRVPCFAGSMHLLVGPFFGSGLLDEGKRAMGIASVSGVMASLVRVEFRFIGEDDPWGCVGVLVRGNESSLEPRLLRVTLRWFRISRGFMIVPLSSPRVFVSSSYDASGVTLVLTL